MIYSLGEKKPSFDADNVWIADSADLIGDVVLNKDVSVWFNVTMRGDNDTITIERGQIFKTIPSFIPTRELKLILMKTLQ